MYIVKAHCVVIWRARSCAMCAEIIHMSITSLFYIVTAGSHCKLQVKADDFGWHFPISDFQALVNTSCIYHFNNFRFYTYVIFSPCLSGSGLLPSMCSSRCDLVAANRKSPLFALLVISTGVNPWSRAG